MLAGLLRDWWLPAALLTLVVYEVETAYAGLDAGRSALLTALVPLVLVTGRRRHEPVVTAIATSLLAVIYVFGVQADATMQPPLAAFLSLLTALFALGVLGAGRGFLPGALAVAVLLGMLQIGSALAGQTMDDVIPASLFMVGVFVIGRLIHRSRAEASAERVRAQVLEEQREEHIAAATARERTRIARELHDVVAHSLSLMVVQASVEARLFRDPESTAASTLRSIEHQGRAALVELRRLLGLLHADEAGASLHPLPTLARLEDVLNDLRRAGHRVELQQTGAARELPPGIDLAAYRVLQEALTNVARHAPGSDVVVGLEFAPDSIAIRVENGCARSVAIDVSGQGFGLEGMRERVRVYGGSLRAAPGQDGGFTVEAAIPVMVQ
jgi:signal transduction histidine kinase